MIENLGLKIFLKFLVSLEGVPVVKLLDCSFKVNKFELWSRYYIHFQTWKKYELRYSPLVFGYNNITAILLQGWLGH